MTKEWTSFKKGLFVYLSGLRILKEVPSAWIFVFLPYFLSGFLILFSFVWGGSQIFGVVQWALTFFPFEPGGFWYGLLYYPFVFLLWISFAIVMTFLFYILVSIISSPFYSFMTEKILMYRKVIRETPFQFEEFLRLSFRMLKVAIWKILIFGLLGVVIFIFSFIPVLNLVSLALSYFLMAIDSMDYSWEVKGMEFSERVQDIFVNKSFLFGVSLAIAFVSLVPALPLVLMPLAIAGCAEYFSHSDHTLSKGTCYGKS